jgi:hypothetical protein
MARAVAINVGANTNEPGVRGPIYPDGSAEFVPIPETEPTRQSPPTYADLDLETDVPQPERPVHLDPEFAAYPFCERYSYGDPWGVKARPLLDLAAGDHVLFYASLEPRGAGHPAWVTPGWGAYLIGGFRLDRDPVAGADYEALSAADRERFATNAHVRRETMDAAVLLSGASDSRGLFETAVPLSAERGTAANEIVTDLSADSGRGPWWRRPLRFDTRATEQILELCDRNPPIL